MLPLNFITKRLPATPNATAPDSSDMHILLGLSLMLREQLLRHRSSAIPSP